MKALILHAEPWRYGLLQGLRALSTKFCYTGPLSSLKLADVPEPALPSPEWLRIRTRLCGFCGSDLNLILMKDSPTAMPFTSFPCVPGHEICGQIVEKGREAGDFKPGDLVVVSPQLNCETRGIHPSCSSCAGGHTSNCENYAEGSLAPGLFTGICRDINGGFAPYLVAHRSQLFRVPAGTTPESAVLTEPLAVALQAVLDNRPHDEESILVIGGGVIGLLVVRVIRSLGCQCRITVADPSSLATEYAVNSGADKVISGNIIDAAVEITGGRTYKPLLGESIVMGGFHRIYDTVGSRQTLHRAMRILATAGVLSVLGIGGHVKLDLTPLWLKLQSIRGCYGYGWHKTGRTMNPVFGMALDMIAWKKVSVMDMLTHTYPLEEYRTLIDVNLNKGKNRAMKTAFLFD